MVISIGIDVAKRTHEAWFMGQDGREVSKPLRFRTTRAGVRALLAEVQRLPQPVTLGLAATGHSWLALHDALVRAGLQVQVRTPLQTHADRRTTGRTVTSDRRDAWLIADVVRIGRGRAASVPDETILHRRELTRFRWGLIDQIGDAKRKALTILDRVFPEEEGLFSDIFIASSRAPLRQATTAAAFAAADLDEVAALLRRTSRGKLGRPKAEAVQAAARDSLGLERLGAVAGFELRALLDQIACREQQVAATERQTEALLATVEQHLTAVTGLNAVLAAGLLAAIGDIGRVPRLESLVAYAGLDPTVCSSGECSASQAHMSTRGSPALRRALWLAAISASRWNPDLEPICNAAWPRASPGPSRWARSPASCWPGSPWC